MSCKIYFHIIIYNIFNIAYFMRMLIFSCEYQTFATDIFPKSISTLFFLNIAAHTKL